MEAMMWLTMLGKAYIHNKRLIFKVSNSFVLSICGILFCFEGAKVVKKIIIEFIEIAYPNPKELCIFATHFATCFTWFVKLFKKMKFRTLFVFWSCFFCLAANNCCVSSGKDGIAKELRSMEKDIPLPYNEALDKTMNQLAEKNLPKTFKDYEAFVDSALTQRNMPLEIRYLPYALSGMKANYQSGDRRGYWALPSLVGMRYGLSINESGDERFSVKASTLAALDYLNDLHKKYNNWWYSILAYANSPTSLSHALIHHGSEPELWDIYEQSMMPDTKVISDFIACVYLGNEDRLSFSANADVASEVEIAELNQTEVAEPVEALTEQVKAAEPVEAPTEQVKVAEPVEASTEQENIAVTKEGPSTSSGTPTQEEEYKKYKIKKGDTLWGIATRHHVTVDNLMEWNHLTSDKIIEGHTLLIKKQ